MNSTGLSLWRVSLLFPVYQLLRDGTKSQSSGFQRRLLRNYPHILTGADGLMRQNPRQLLL